MDKVCGRCSSPVKGDRCPVCGYDCSADRDPVALKAGTSLDGRYVIGRVIGTGSSGVTYIAYDVETEKTVAIKEYYPKGIAIRCEDDIMIEPLSSLHEEDFAAGMERFMQEAEILSEYGETDDIIKVYGTFRENGSAYYVMEYVHGMTVKEYIERYGVMSEEQAVYMMIEAAKAFGHIHSRNVIHRDISPNNIMITIDGRVRLVDFGNARVFLTGAENSMTVMLKPGFAPLEQYQHHGVHGPWTDIYSLGAVIYYAVTREILDDPMTRLDNDMKFRRGLSGMTPEFAALVDKMAAVRYSDRYQSSEELLNDLKISGLRPKTEFR